MWKKTDINTKIKRIKILKNIGNEKELILEETLIGKAKKYIWGENKQKHISKEMVEH